MQAVVLAGGFGTRLRARVPDLPKPMAPIAGRPFLEYLLDRLARFGGGRVVLATGHLSEAIVAHFGARYRGLDLQYSHEATPLGTGGAIVQALGLLPPEPTLVLNGDTWQDVDLQDFVRWCEANAAPDAMVLRRVPNAGRYGSVRLDAGGRVVAFAEKDAEGPGLVNAGIYRFRRATFEGQGLPAAFSVENDFLRPRVAALDVRGYVTEGRFIDIGIPEDFDRAQVELPRWAAGA